jgi:hypothetical protein
MTVFRTAPQYEQPLIIGQNTSSSWYRWFQNIDFGIPPSSEIPVTVSASPFIYSATQKGTLLISGGTISAIAYSRTRGTFYNTGQISGAIAMSANDQIKVTYSGIPTMVFMPS